MLTAHQISKSYHLDTILEKVSFNIHAGERLGLIGPNGCGKTTLLRILAREEYADSGSVSFTPSNLRVGYLPQGFNPAPDLTLETLFQKVSGDPKILEVQLAELAAQLGDNPDDSLLQREYDEVLYKIQFPSPLARLQSILRALELDTLPVDQPAGTFSGGQKTRFSLALVLLSDPELFLLDEPTNHLDIGMLEWLENWLSEFRGAAIIVSHDRTFLERTVTRILELNSETHRVKSYDGAYTHYIEQVTREHEKQWVAYKDQITEIRRMKQDIARTKEQARQVEITTSSREPGVRRYAKKVARKALSRQKKLDRYLDSDEHLEKPKAAWQIKLEFEEPAHLGKDVLLLEELSVGYLGIPPLLTGVNLQAQAGQRIAFTGPNGSGKTTLLRAIAGQIVPLQGRVILGSSVKLGYMSQEQDSLDPLKNAVATIQALARFNPTETRNFLHYFLFSGDDPLRPIAQLSYGERARLLLACLAAQGCNFLLLDEPINHLDIPSRERFEQALLDFEGTILAVVHDRYFIQRFATELWVLEEGRIRRNILR